MLEFDEILIIVKYLLNSAVVVDAIDKYPIRFHVIDGFDQFGSRHGCHVK